MADSKQVVARRLVMGINASPHVTHKLKVLKSQHVGKAIYIKGDEIEVNRFEAADLMVAYPGDFAPVDDLSKKLKAAIVGGVQ